MTQHCGDPNCLICLWQFEDTQQVPQMDRTHPWTREHCLNYPQAAATLINELLVKEAEFHRAITPLLNKRDQGLVMGAYRQVHSEKKDI